METLGKGQVGGGKASLQLGYVEEPQACLAQSDSAGADGVSTQSAPFYFQLFILRLQPSGKEVPASP